jgi:hypothetical protein
MDYLSHFEEITNISLQFGAPNPDVKKIQNSIGAIRENVETGLTIADRKIEKLVGELEKRYWAGGLRYNGM